MLIGLIADTHGLLRPEVLDAFADVEHILHAGDVGSPDVLDGLRAIAPVTAVGGNVDAGLGLPELACCDLDGIQILVVHGDRLGSPTPEKVAERYSHADLVVYGHSHRPALSRIGESVVVNPGSAGRRRFRDPVSVARAELHDDKVDVVLVPL